VIISWISFLLIQSECCIYND